ncbi:MAG: helix-turn-helix transcriptional regulator [Hyphomonadaceae bacterium]
MELDMSQPELAERVGVTFQQVQKYENGKNRVSAGRLDEIAKALGVTIQFFYESAPRLAVARRGVAEEHAGFDAPDTAEELELLAAFRRIEFANARKAVIDLAKKQAKPGAKTVRKPAKTKR